MKEEDYGLQPGTGTIRRAQGSVQSRELTEAEMKARLQDLMVQDEQGNWWVIGYETGRWYRHNGTNWVQEDPPGRRDQEPTAAAIPEAARAGNAQISPRTKAQAEPEEKRSTRRLGAPLLALAMICGASLVAAYYLLPGLAQARGPAATPGIPGTTLRSSQTSEPTPTTQAELHVRIAVSRAAIYQGPGLDYPMADSNWHLEGEDLTIIARDPSGTWLLSRTANGIEGWLYFQWVNSDFDVSTVPTASSIPLAPPAPTRKPKENACPAHPYCQNWDPIACVCN